jgi:hypothetical protein
MLRRRTLGIPPLTQNDGETDGSTRPDETYLTRWKGDGDLYSCGVERWPHPKPYVRDNLV